MPDQPPRLKLTFAGEGFRQGAVPLTVVASKLQALQQAMFHAAAAVQGHAGGRRGQWYNRFRPVAELTFASSHHSDLVIEAELAPDPVLREDLSLGRNAVDLLFEVATAIETDDFETVKLNRYDRDYMIRALEGLMPNSGDQYVVMLDNCQVSRHPRVTFTQDTKQRVKAYISNVEGEIGSEEVTIVGELIRIQVGTGEDKITIRSQRRDVDCFYGDALHDQVTNLVAGSMVEVSGFATLNDRDQVARMHQMTNVEHVSMEPLHIARFEYAGRVCSLSEPISVNIEYTDGLWVYNYPGLNLWGYAARRDKALENLHADFIDLYGQIGEAEPEILDEVAQQVRTRLRRIVTPTGGQAHA